MFNYFTSRAYGSTTADYDQVFSVMVERYAAGFLDIPRAMRDFIVSATKVGILPLSVVACIVLHAIARPPAPNIIMLDLWVIGLLAASAGIPFVEQMACRSYRVVPFEIDLIRNIRYLIPCMEIYCLLALAALPAYFKGRATRIVPAALGLAAFALWGFVNLGEYVRAASTGQMKRQYRSGSEQADWLSMLLEVRTSTPARSRILPIGDVDALPIRYFALRPVVYCWKDGGSFGYSNHAALLRWKEVEERVRQIEQQASPIELLLTARKLAGDLSADYVLIKMQLADVKEASPSVAGLELAVSTETFSLLKVRSPGRDADGSESWARRRTRLRDALRDVYRFPREQVELSPLIHRKLEGDGYHVESITFRSECNSRVTALLYVPADGEGPFPAIVVACGHGGSKSSLYAQYAGQLYAKLGFVCLVPDTLGEEERNSRGQMGTREHDEIGALKLPPEDRRRLKRMVFGKIVWDLIRGFDYLETRPEVDPSRLGIVGYSLGGAAAGSAATIDERIRAAVISSWAFRQRNATYGKYCTRLPYEAISKLMGFDEMTALVAPHAATLFMCGEHDTILDPDEGGAAVVRDLATNIGSARRRIFIAGCSTPIELSVQEGAGHRPYFLSHGAVDWMQRHLVEPLNRREIPVRRLSFGQWAKAMGQRIEPRYDKAERERGLQIVDIGAIYHDPVDLACFPARNLPVDEYTMKGWIDAALQRVPNP
jgi:dienelactone hydrolase